MLLLIALCYFHIIDITYSFLLQFDSFQHLAHCRCREINQVLNQDDTPFLYSIVLGADINSVFLPCLLLLSVGADLSRTNMMMQHCFLDTSLHPGRAISTSTISRTTSITSEHLYDIPYIWE